MNYVEYLESPNPYIDGFRVGDRVRFRDGYRTTWTPELSIGTITHISSHSFEVLWDEHEAGHIYTKFHIASKEWWEKVAYDADLTIGDRVVFVAIGFGQEGKIGTITGEQFDKRKKITRQTIAWDDGTICEYHYKGSNTLRKVLENPKDNDKPKFKVLEKSNGGDFPELLVVPKTHGYLEEYFVVNKQGRVYFYTRYVYQESSGKLKHYHVGKKQKESIETLWRSGATAKEICLALGKNLRH